MTMLTQERLKGVITTKAERAIFQKNLEKLRPSRESVIKAFCETPAAKKWLAEIKHG